MTRSYAGSADSRCASICVLEGGGQGRVVHRGHLEQLAKRGLGDVSAFGDGRGALADDEAGRDVPLEPAADELLLRVVGAEAGHQVDLVAEPGHVVRAGQRPARLPLEPDVLRGDHRVLGRLAQGHAVAVLVDDRLADDENLQPPKRGQRVAHHGGGVPKPEAFEEASRPRDRARHAEARPPGTRNARVQQGGGGEHGLVGESHVAAQLAYRRDLLLEPGAAPGRVLAGLTLDVVVRPEQPDGLHRGGPGADGHEVDASQRGERLGPQGLGKGRPALALVHVRISRDRDDQQVSHRARGLQMSDVPDVHQVEAPVAVDDLEVGAPREPSSLRARSWSGRILATVIAWLHTATMGAAGGTDGIVHRRRRPCQRAGAMPPLPTLGTSS